MKRYLLTQTIGMKSVSLFTKSRKNLKNLKLAKINEIKNLKTFCVVKNITSTHLPAPKNFLDLKIETCDKIEKKIALTLVLSCHTQQK